MTQSLNDLQKYAESQNFLDRGIPLEERYAAAARDSFVREVLDIETPQINDFTSTLEIQNDGKVYAVRMDLNRGVDNHKKPVVAGLILRGILTHRIPKDEITTFIDAGNFNSAKAVKYYAERFNMKGVYVMSRLFPQDVTDLLESESFRVIRAPYRYDHKREREFYEFLFEKIRDPSFKKDKFCLWHAKYGGEVIKFLGEEIGKALPEIPNYTVSCIGAGSTLTGIQLSLQDYYISQGVKRIPITLIAEHERSPLFASLKPIREVSHCADLESRVKKSDYRTVDELPHLVIGPHYDEINPLLSQEAINKIEGVVQYSEHLWKTTQEHLLNNEISIGNSSAANINVAARLASEGNKVLTIVFEPLREFYKRIICFRGF